jgi:hypothetical protein
MGRGYSFSRRKPAAWQKASSGIREIPVRYDANELRVEAKVCGIWPEDEQVS